MLAREARLPDGVGQRGGDRGLEGGAAHHAQWAPELFRPGDHDGAHAARDLPAALRQTEGLLGSVLHLLGLGLSVPDHSTLGRRTRTVKLPALPHVGNGPLHLLVDSTGLKLCRPGEWLVERHGTKRRRSWRKLHIGMDSGTGRIVAATLTGRAVDDAQQVAPLLEQVPGPLTSLTGDGGYDRTSVYATVHERHPSAAVVVPPRVDAVSSDAAETAPSQRDRHIQVIAEGGRRT
jgi:hypothetical protein